MYLVFIYLLYGLAFVVFGLVLGLQARTPIRTAALPSPWLLGAFGVLHGLAEWATIPVLMGGDSVLGSSIDFSRVALILTAVSFVFLLQFGVETLSEGIPRLVWLRFVTVAIFVAIAALLFGGAWSGQIGDGRWLASSEGIVRYFLAFPGSLLAALALARAARQTAPGESRSAAFLWSTALVFIAYAFLAGLVVPAAPFSPANTFNVAWFRSTFGFPVQIARAVCAVFATAFLAEVFVVESTRQYVRRRQELDRLKDEFISVASHELRGPIAILMGYADLLSRSSRKASPDEGRLSEAILAQARRLAAMVDRMLDASRIQAGRLELKTAPMDLVTLGRRLVEQFQLTHPTHQINFVADLPTVVGHWDEGRIEEVLTNLLDNAVKYSPGGGPVEVVIGARDGWAEVSVSDCGVGIPAQARAHLFERYYRAPLDGQRPPGLGLGLYFSREVVLLHGGTIWFESTENKGTVFHFTLPL